MSVWLQSFMKPYAAKARAHYCRGEDCGIRVLSRCVSLIAEYPQQTNSPALCGPYDLDVIRRLKAVTALGIIHFLSHIVEGPNRQKYGQTRPHAPYSGDITQAGYICEITHLGGVIRFGNWFNQRKLPCIIASWGGLLVKNYWSYDVAQVLKGVDSCIGDSFLVLKCPRKRVPVWFVLARCIGYSWAVCHIHTNP